MRGREGDMRGLEEGLCAPLREGRKLGRQGSGKGGGGVRRWEGGEAYPLSTLSSLGVGVGHLKVCPFTNQHDQQKRSIRHIYFMMCIL